MSEPRFDAPIPGANFTADTKNFPWHRSTKNQDFVSTVDHLMKKIAEPAGVGFILTAIEEGETILDVTTGLLRLSVSNGNTSIDNAILAAGPVARAVEQLAKDADLKYRKGWPEKEQMLTKAKVDALRGRPSRPETEPEEETMDTGPAGFATPDDQPAPAPVQSSMLGYDDDDEVMA